MSYPGLSANELDTIKSMFAEIKIAPSSTLAMEYRNEIFNGKKQTARVRYWFDQVPGIKLTDDELNAIKKKYKDWSIIHNILKYQTQLSGAERIEFFELIGKSDRMSVTMTMLLDSQVDYDYKMKLVDDFLEQGNPNHQRNFIQVLERELVMFGEGFWNDVFDKLGEYINSEHTLSKAWARMWVDEGQGDLDVEAKYKNYKSALIYEFSGKEQYLPQEAVDLFLF